MGKSTLMNGKLSLVHLRTLLTTSHWFALSALLGESLSIVSAKPQTTRHRILGVLTHESNTSSSSANATSNYQLVFSDTPGMLDPVYMLQETMQETVIQACYPSLLK